MAVPGTVQTVALGVREDILNCCPRPPALGNSLKIFPDTSGQQYELFPDSHETTVYCYMVRISLSNKTYFIAVPGTVQTVEDIFNCCPQPPALGNS